MLARIDPTSTQSWSRLKQHFQEVKDLHMRDLFLKDPERFQRFSLWLGDEILVDFSKNRLTQRTLELLMDLARECRLEMAIRSMFSAETINETEGRAVLHVALRNLSGESVLLEGRDVMPEVRSVWEKMKVFCQDVRSGRWLGYTGKPIRDIVNIGIGGSDLGPRMAAQCLRPYGHPGLSLHFVSNVDGAQIVQTLEGLDPEATLFMISSKSFTTQETMTNAHTARQWFLHRAKDPAHVARHFVAISTQADRVKAFGIDPANMFQFWDWVGGRFSLWSAIGLSLACYIGFERFQELLQGAHEMDLHFKNTPLEKNIPVILALISIWYNNFFGTHTEAVIPYDQSMEKFPAYLQQASMESNGKALDRAGRRVSYETAPILWGQPGTDGQHAFFQLLHQGTRLVPADFLAPALSHHQVGPHHDILLSNFLAQTEALMMGKSLQEVQEEMASQGFSSQEIERLAPYRSFEGNRPSNTILFPKLTPKVLGSLIALYEHKIFVQGVIWNIFSFDQWGVELGKQLAGRILKELQGAPAQGKHDASTLGLMSALRLMRERQATAKDSQPL
ncbi:MAG: glucose-6-phosphate isomerase [bacterium]